MIVLSLGRSDAARKVRAARPAPWLNAFGFKTDFVAVFGFMILVAAVSSFLTGAECQ